MLKYKYELIKNPPACIDEIEYENSIKKDFINLLEQELIEDEYQTFLEKNPGMILSIAKNSGLAPLGNILFSQPQLYGNVRRVPDFLVITQTSIGLHPVFIEIEKPSKLQFRKDNVPRQDFNQALDQITEWKTLLQRPETIKNFYDDFHIDARLRTFKFAPQFLLIYGRRSEYEENSFLRNKRAEMEKEDTTIASFDRLLDLEFDNNAITCKAQNSLFNVVAISPLFRYKPVFADTIRYVEKRSFSTAVRDNYLISEERKSFLIKRFDYWRDFSNLENRGLICSSDYE